jgi:hypothetical protein
MTNCSKTCLNDGICSHDNSCQCLSCFTGVHCEINVNVNKFSLTYSMVWDIRYADKTSKFNAAKFSYAFIIAFLVLLALINNSLCLKTFLSYPIRLTNCGVLQILLSCTSLSAIVGMQIRMLIMLKFDDMICTHAYRYLACNVIPVFVILMNNVSMWLSACLAIEYTLLECFNMNLYRTRWVSFVSSIVIFLFVSATHLHEIIARHPIADPKDARLYSCTFIYSLPLDLIDKILRICHVVIPCIIHFISSCTILICITRRNLFLGSRQDYIRTFLHQCMQRRYLFIPPVCFITSNLPHLILHLKNACQDARNISQLRFHIASNILVYLPLAFTFLIYIYPSKRYMQKFYTTSIGQCLKRFFYRTESLFTIHSATIAMQQIDGSISPYQNNEYRRDSNEWMVQH